MEMDTITSSSSKNELTNKLKEKETELNSMEKENELEKKEKEEKTPNASTQNQTPSHIPRKQSLFERNKKTKFVYNHIMKRMDEYAFARSITLFAVLSFFLGNNLNIFLWCFIATSIYIMSYRIVRFWIRRYLLYLFEFCYFGFMLLMYFLLFDNKNMQIFSMCFICNTGLMTIAIVIFNNQTHFNSTDHLTSSWVHTLPLIVDWSIRWRHCIYPKETLEKLGFDFQDFSQINFEMNEVFYGLIIYPFLFWISWAFAYLILMCVIFKGFQEDSRYGDGLTDFVEFFKNKKMCGNSKKCSILKYLFQHFLFFILGYPIAIFAFYNYYFNTIYLIFIMVFLAWNTVRNNIKKQSKNQKADDDY